MVRLRVKDVLIRNSSMLLIATFLVRFWVLLDVGDLLFTFSERLVVDVLSDLHLCLACYAIVCVLELCDAAWWLVRWAINNSRLQLTISEAPSCALWVIFDSWWRSIYILILIIGAVRDVSDAFLDFLTCNWLWWHTILMHNLQYGILHGDCSCINPITIVNGSILSGHDSLGLNHRSIDDSLFCLIEYLWRLALDWLIYAELAIFM